MPTHHTQSVQIPDPGPAMVSHNGFWHECTILRHVPMNGELGAKYQLSDGGCHLAMWDMFREIKGGKGMNYKGAIVKYVKSGGRRGWTGKIVRHWTGPCGPRIRVVFDNGTIQEYSESAVIKPGGPTGDYEPGYLEIITWDKVGADDPTPRKVSHLVKGAEGGRYYECYSLEEAQKLAEQKARDSKSGQAYSVFVRLEDYQRDPAPVRRTSFEEEV